MEITIGADPELFAFDVPNKEFKSVHNILPGTKWKPSPVDKGAVQVDGVAAEFNIQPAKTAREFVRNITMVKGRLQEILNEKEKEWVLMAVPTAHFAQDYFSLLPDSALALGCEPDFNAYTGNQNEKPTTTKSMRTGSGHVHIGWDSENRHDSEVVMGLVRDLDLGLAAQSPAWDDDTERRELYGNLGAFRFKPYGVEYRVLSNAWLKDKKTMRFIFDATKAVVSNFFHSTPLQECISPYIRGNTALFHESLRKSGIPVFKDYKNA